MFIKKKRLSAKRQRILNLQKRNYHENPENKRKAENRRYDDKKESVKQYQKEKYCIYPAGNYMFKLNNRDTRTRCEICSKLTIKTPERRQ